MFTSLVPARGTTARRCLSRFAILTIAAAASLNAQAALYLKFDGVDGESTAIGHEKWSVIQQASLIVTSTSSASGGSGGAGGSSKTTISDINWVQAMDLSYPTLFGDIVSGKHIATADIALTTVGNGREVSYFKMHFDDVQLTTLNLNLNSFGPAPLVTGAFNFSKIALTYIYFDAKGVAKENTAAWDLKLGEAPPASLFEVYALGFGPPPSISSVPLPAGAWLAVSGLFALGSAARRRRS